MTQRTTTRASVSVPADLQSARAKLVYLYLAVAGTATADDVRDALALEKGTVLSITGALREQGHVRREDGGYRVA